MVVALVLAGVIGCSAPAASEPVAPGYGGFRVTVQNDLSEAIVAYSDRHFEDLPVAAKQVKEMEWFGTKDPLDDGGNEKIARLEAYRLVGSVPNSDADQDYQRGDLVFCRDLTFRELASVNWTVKVVSGDVRCEPRTFFVLP
jgi:hypothetical protein